MIILPPLKNKKIVFLAAGNIMRGDDAFGPMLYEELRPLSTPFFITMDGGELPENMCGPIIKHRPDILILADAALIPGAEPGALTLAEADDIQNPAVSTHTLPLSVMLGFLKQELPDLKVIFIAANAANTEFGAEPGEHISTAVKTAKTAILKALNQ